MQGIVGTGSSVGEVGGEASNPTNPTMDVDYERYAEGEAMLGWVNATVWAKSDAVVTSAEQMQRCCRCAWRSHGSWRMVERKSLISNWVLFLRGALAEARRSG